MRMLISELAQSLLTWVTRHLCDTIAAREPENFAESLIFTRDQEGKFAAVFKTVSGKKALRSFFYSLLETGLL